MAAPEPEPFAGRPADGKRVDLFVSHAGRDRAWAEWVAWELIDAGYTVELDYWDWEVGENFVEKMRDALERAERMVALFSPAYFEPLRHTTPELAALLADRSPERKRLLPIPLDLFTGPLPAQLATVVDSPLALARTAGRLTRYGLARATPDGLQLHRLTQAILRDTDTDTEREQ